MLSIFLFAILITTCVSQKLKGHVLPEDDDLMNTQVFDNDTYLAITIEDISLMDAPSVRLNKQEIQLHTGDKFPIYYEIDYPEAKRLVSGNRYNVRAMIKNTKQDKLLYLTTTFTQLPKSTDLDKLFPVKVTKVGDLEPREENNPPADTIFKVISEANANEINFDDSTNPCMLEAERGNCRGFFEKYYFDSASSECQTFIYGGCDGNDNRFDTIEECENKCKPKVYLN